MRASLQKPSCVTLLLAGEPWRAVFFKYLGGPGHHPGRCQPGWQSLSSGGQVHLGSSPDQRVPPDGGAAGEGAHPQAARLLRRLVCDGACGPQLPLQAGGASLPAGSGPRGLELQPEPLARTVLASQGSHHHRPAGVRGGGLPWVVWEFPHMWRKPSPRGLQRKVRLQDGQPAQRGIWGSCAGIFEGPAMRDQRRLHLRPGLHGHLRSTREAV